MYLAITGQTPVQPLNLEPVTTPVQCPVRF